MIQVSTLFKKYVRLPLDFLGVYSHSRSFYFYILSIRAKILNHTNKILRKTAPILLYHRVASLTFDPVSLAVTPETFEKHISFLVRHFSIIPLSELSRQLMTGTLKDNVASITFDDGYRDNLINALPILEKYNVPATIFVTTGLLGQRGVSVWDMQYSETDRAYFLSEEEVKTLSNHPLIEIGGHTDSHPNLSTLTPEKQKVEIEKCKTILENITGAKISGFAYPFGGTHNFNKHSIGAVKETGFKFAYSNTNLLAVQNGKSFTIPRINIRECGEKELTEKLFMPYTV